MKTHSLTPDQRAKLLTLAGHYYPEFPDIRFGKNWDHDEVWFSNYKHGERLKESKPPIHAEIHWFEFCVTHLVEKILLPDPSKVVRTFQNNLKEFFWKCNLYFFYNILDSDDKNSFYKKEDLTHPVDLLFQMSGLHEDKIQEDTRRRAAVLMSFKYPIQPKESEISSHIK